MKKFELTANKYYELRKQMLAECKVYLTEVAKAWGDKQFPLSTINREFDCNDAYCCIVYDGGNHPEYASNACSEVESVYMRENVLTFSIEDDGRYEYDRVDGEDIITIAYAVDAAIDYVLDELIALIGGEGTIENGKWTISRETWNRLVDLAESRDNLDRYLDDESDDEEWLQSMRECYNPQGYVTLIKRVAQIGDNEITWEWQ